MVEEKRKTKRKSTLTFNALGKIVFYGYDKYVLYVSLRWYNDRFMKNIAWHMI